MEVIVWGGLDGIAFLCLKNSNYYVEDVDTSVVEIILHGLHSLQACNL